MMKPLKPAPKRKHAGDCLTYIEQNTVGFTFIDAGTISATCRAAALGSKKCDQVISCEGYTYSDVLYDLAQKVAQIGGAP